LPGAEFEVSVNQDPLIIWSFNEISEEQRITYELGEYLSEECRKAIEGTGIAEGIRNHFVQVQDYEIPAMPTMEGHREDVGTGTVTTPTTPTTPPIDCQDGTHDGQCASLGPNNEPRRCIKGTYVTDVSAEVCCAEKGLEYDSNTGRCRGVGNTV